MISKTKVLTLLLILFFISFTYSLTGQQQPLFSLYKDHYGLINPAFVNSEFMLYSNFNPKYRKSAGLSHRTQWIGNAGTISTQTLRGEYIMKTNGSIAPIFGLHFIRDDIEPTKLTGTYARLGGLLETGIGFFSLGLNFGIVEHRIDASKVELLDDSDPILQTDHQQRFPDVGLGFFYFKEIGDTYSADYIIYAGLSVPQFWGLNLAFRNEDAYQMTRVRHYYATAGLIKVLDQNQILEFSTWVKYNDPAPLNVDLNIRYQKNYAYWLGLGGALNGTLHVEGGGFYNFDNKNIVKYGAGFDFGLKNNLGQFNKSFEVNISYFIK